MSTLGEIARKGTHIGVLIITFTFLHFPRDIALITVFAGAIIALTQDLLRIYNPAFRRFVYRSWGKIYRSWEQKRLGGAVYILTAASLTILFFEPRIAGIVMAYISVGDTLAVFTGRRYGKILLWQNRNKDGTVRRKTLEGSIAFFIGAFLAGFLVPSVPLKWNIIGAFVATIVEACSLWVDDNLTVPVITGAVMTFLMHYINC